MKLSFNLNRTKAILIGTSEYENFIDIPPVSGNLNDFAEVLADKDIFGLPDSHIIKLFDKKHDEILLSIHSFLQNKDNIDIETLILYFAGHGYRTRSKELYLITKNSHKEFVENTAVPYKRIKNLIENSNIQQRIVFIDACHSGIATMDDSDKTYTENELDIKGTYVITSSAGNEKSLFDAELKNTFFTGELLQIFKNGQHKQTQYLTLDDCFDSLQHNLINKKLPCPQRKTNLNIPGFYFFKNKKFDKKDIIEQAIEFYKNGDYNNALQKFEILRDKFSDSAFDTKIKKCKDEIELKTHLEIADNLFKEKKYEQALNKYYKAAFIRKDIVVDKKINECENYLRIKNDIFEEQFWENTRNADKVEGYIEYLEKYPSGKFKYEAEEKINQIKEIKEEEEITELPEKSKGKVQKKHEEQRQQATSDSNEKNIIKSIINLGELEAFLQKHQVSDNENDKDAPEKIIKEDSISIKIEKSGELELFLKKRKITSNDKRDITNQEFSRSDSKDQINLIETSGLIETFLRKHEIQKKELINRQSNKKDIVKAIEASGMIEIFLKKYEKKQKKGFFTRIIKKLEGK